MDALHGLERSGDFKHRVKTFQAIPQSTFVVDVRKRLRSIWNQANQLGNEDQTDKAAKYPGLGHAYFVAFYALKKRLKFAN